MSAPLPGPGLGGKCAASPAHGAFRAVVGLRPSALHPGSAVVVDRTVTRADSRPVVPRAWVRRYWKLHAQGKTEQAKGDLARLAIIRKQREEEAAKRAAELAAKNAK